MNPKNPETRCSIDNIRALMWIEVRGYVYERIAASLRSSVRDTLSETLDPIQTLIYFSIDIGINQ